VSTPTTRRAGYRSAPQAFAGSSWQRGFSPESLSNPSNEVAGNIVANSALLGRPELERRWIDLFWEAYFPAGKPIPALVSRNYTCSWTNTAQKLYEGDHSLRYALWANALLMEGRRQGAGWILREGSKMYGRALAGLRRSLEAPHTAKRDAVIATVKLVSLFEAYSRQGGGDESESEGDDHHNHQPRALPPLPSQNWQRHCAGELALFVARTPEAHVEGNSHQVFADERVEMVSSLPTYLTYLRASHPPVSLNCPNLFAILGPLWNPSAKTAAVQRAGMEKHPLEGNAQGSQGYPGRCLGRRARSRRGL